jgi:hypothetical protein
LISGQEQRSGTLGYVKRPPAHVFVGPQQSILTFSVKEPAGAVEHPQRRKRAPDEEGRERQSPIGDAAGPLEKPELTEPAPVELEVVAQELVYRQLALRGTGLDEVDEQVGADTAAFGRRRRQLLPDRPCLGINPVDAPDDLRRPRSGDPNAYPLSLYPAQNRARQNRF